MIDSHAFVNAMVYALLGVAMFAIGFVLMDKLTPYDLWKEIVEGNNVALAVLIGLMSLGMCIIIAAAVH